MTNTVERIAGLATLLEEPLQEKLWEYAELLYIEQVAFDSPDASRLAEDLVPDVFSQPPDTLVTPTFSPA